MSLDEDAQRELKNFFEGTVQEVYKYQESLYEEVCGIYQKNGGKDIYRLVNGYVQQFKTELCVKLHNDYNNWQDSEYSIQQMIKDSGEGEAGDEIVKDAERLEDELNDLLKSEFTNKGFDSMKETRLHQADTKDDVIDKIVDCCDKKCTELEQEKDEIEKSIKIKKEENFLYSSIEILLGYIIQTNINFLTKLKKEMDNDVRETLLYKSEKIMQIQEDAKQFFNAKAELEYASLDDFLI